MIYLPNGCRCSELSVSPRNWDKKSASAVGIWQIQYRFYDPTVIVNGKIKPKLCVVKGMNQFKSVSERREAVRILLENELERLKAGYNPIKQVIQEQEKEVELSPNTPFVKALNIAYGKVSAVRETKADIRSVIKGTVAAAESLGFSMVPVSQVGRKVIKLILERCAVLNPRWSNNRHNVYKDYLTKLFKELVELEMTDSNPVKEISKKKVIRKIRETLTQEERVVINKHLHDNHYYFWRFLHIFFHSGSRETELMRLRTTDVNLHRQQYKAVVLKGGEPREVIRPIKDSVVGLWEEVLRECKPGAYLFTKHLQPGDQPIHSSQINRRWRRHVKLNKKITKDLGSPVTADFYSLKHSNSDETAALLDIRAAALQNSHTSVGTTKIYAIGEVAREMERLKKLQNKFA